MSKELMIADVVNGTTGMVTTLANETHEEKVFLYNAMTNPDHQLKSFVNKNIHMKDFIITKATFVDEETGEIKDVPQTIIVDEFGETYRGTSNGLANALTRIFSIFGSPSDWAEPLEVTVLDLPCKEGSYTSLQVV